MFRSAEALDHLARCASNAKDARRSVDRYLQLVRLYPKSSLADDSLYRAARLRGQILRDKAGAQELLQQILEKIPFFQYGQGRLQLPCNALAQRKTTIAFRRQQGKQAKTA